MFSDNIVISDVVAGVLTAAITVSLLKLLELTATRGVFAQTVNRKLVHIGFGLVFMLCWPMFSSGHLGAVVASLIPATNVVNMLLLGSGIRKDEATVKSMTRHGDYRELLKGPLCYISALTFFTALYWRASPVTIAVFCNLCAGDGVADIFGRHYGRKKLPYNRNKSFAGTIAMAFAGFLASIAYMLYFSWFGYVEASWIWVARFSVVSFASALVESHPISTQLDDNLTVPLAVVLLGTFLF